MRQLKFHQFTAYYFYKYATLILLNEEISEDRSKVGQLMEQASCDETHGFGHRAVHFVLSRMQHFRVHKHDWSRHLYLYSTFNNTDGVKAALQY